MSIRATVTVLAVLCVQTSYAYSILAHEALIDSCWASAIRPLLLWKYPGATEAQLKKAHAFAYGGAIAPDIGYFPFGKPFFTDLVHYVRSGDFTNALLDDARDINEYAFAIGWLCHYMADEYGHSLATNQTVPMLYPKEQKKYGDYVTYEEDHISHRRTEFGFDVLQTAESDYASIAYHDFIGFEISDTLLATAFTEVYGLDIHDVFANFSLATGTLRWSFKRLFPALTKAAWILKKNQLGKDSARKARKTYVYSMKKADYYKEFGKERERPGPFSALFAFFVTVVPKVGPTRAMKFKAPGPEAAKLYHNSFNVVVTHYTAALRAFRRGGDRLANIDFDTGDYTEPGEYGMADKNYDLLVVDLQKNNFKLMNRDLRKNIIEYYSHRVPPRGSSKKERAWARTEAALNQLRETRVVAAQ